jgi:hypothetical protein
VSISNVRDIVTDSAQLWPDCKLFWGPWVDHKEEE